MPLLTTTFHYFDNSTKKTHPYQGTKVLSYESDRSSIPLILLFNEATKCWKLHLYTISFSEQLSAGSSNLITTPNHYEVLFSRESHEELLASCQRVFNETSRNSLASRRGS